MIPLKELCEHLNLFLRCSEFTDYGPNGLQVEGKAQVKKIATAVSASLLTIEAAAEWGADALIVHHGLFWNKDKYEVTGVKRDKLKLLLARGISLLAYHLPLDAHEEVGNNWKAASDLGLTALAPFSFGVQGKMKPRSIDAFKNQLEQYYSHPAACALGGKEKVQTAAIISGGAHWSIKEAAAAGIDCFITGSFDEPIWHIAFEEKINFFALGHAATERIGPLALGEHLKEKWSLPVQFIDMANPF
jgi:dinuclear metal center YbgI/SA1388 family protein